MLLDNPYFPESTLGIAWELCSKAVNSDGQVQLTLTATLPSTACMLRVCDVTILNPNHRRERAAET